MATEADQVNVEATKYLNAGDAEGLLSMYEDGALLLLEPTSTVEECQDLRSGVQTYLDMEGTITIEASSELVVGDLALIHSRWRFEVPGEEPQVAVSAEVARRQPDGTWKYVIDNPYAGDILG